ncbi:GGDEF domain-containing protein [Marinomonas sp. A79]|uniref:GGDEF domain-containing protein n=1 Tax=Marinomonas vulgaris TaxID=2823372 RepID=A0ABS5HCV9_9GAMM|nr:GGDEF domain-containing protein [Marinomonas vulgaris]MBR7889252.1 GGDEF domain-containing protein [Marinomonas vulgaris]
MSIDSSNTLLSEHQVLRSRIAYLEKERDFIKSLYGDMPHIIHAISKGSLLSTLLDEFKHKLEAQLPNAYCLFLVCDKSCLHWDVQYKDATNTPLLSSQSKLRAVPQGLITFAASPSCPTRFDDHIAQDADWQPWAEFIADNGFVDVSMSSVSDGQGSIYLAVVFQPETSRIESDLVTLALECYVSWLRAIFEREKADQLLLEDSHRDPTTGLLRRFSFENSFNIVLKDSRRHFLRAALLSLRILSSAKIQEKELVELAEVMRKTVRDNDLIAYFDEHELVMGIRIQHLEDAEVVASKLFASLGSPKFANNRLIQDGLSIGIAFYPEHSSLDGLYRAANAAAEVLNRSTGVRLEFHGEYYQSSADFYTQ